MHLSPTHRLADLVTTGTAALLLRRLARIVRHEKGRLLRPWFSLDSKNNHIMRLGALW